MDNQQLAVSFDTPHHLTSLKYPARDLLTADEQSKFVILPSTISTHVNLPNDLIQDAQVIENATTYNAVETSFFTLERANTRNAWARPALSAVNRPALARLIEDVKTFQATIGDTLLAFVTFRDPNVVPGGTVWLRVYRGSKARMAGGGWHDSASTYEFKADELTRESELPDPPAFIELMMTLLERSNVRAVKHVRLVLTSYDMQTTDRYRKQFLPARGIDWDTPFNTLITPVVMATLGPEDRDCSVCLVPYTAPNDVPVAMPCGHVFGKECIATWYATSSNCPQCRVQAYSVEQRRHITLGLWPNGTYLPDTRFTPYENFDRSCADLDSHSAVPRDMTPFTPNLSLLIKALRVLHAASRLETQISTPKHLRAALAPEMRFVLAQLDDLWTNAQQPSVEATTIPDFVDATASTLRGALLDAAATPESKRFYAPTTLETFRNAPMNVMVAGFPLRPGFELFLRRLLTRTARFQLERACNCTPGFHQHGVRTFYAE
ncbi:hypothetical protein LTR08_008414 [Meristemomyces frigidus]|nr:hypothetical protein LTR08_008414 [Meristemomyces frigidus]